MNDYRMIPGVILIVLGVSALLDINIWTYIWPAFLIFVGVKILSSRSDNSGQDGLPKTETVNTNTINYETIFGGINKKIVSDNFEGGKITNVFGGGEIDLREAKIGEDKTANLEINSIFGGAKIMVPKDWAVTSQITGVMGGHDNKTNLPKKAEEKGRLIITGAAVFGGVEIIN